MQAFRQFGGSILVGTLSLLFILGGLSTTLAENRINEPLPIITEPSTPTRDTVDISTPTLFASDLLPSATIPASPSSTATIPASTVCPAPIGWLTYIVQIGDSLESLAIRYSTTSNALKMGNCLIGTSLLPNTRIYVPPAPTLTPIPCGAPYGWTLYTVKTGDNLYRIGLSYRVSVALLQNANCMGYSTDIKVGQKLSVPNVPTSTPVTTNTPLPTATHTSTATLSTQPPISTSTATEILPSATFTETATVEPPTETPSPAPTETEVSPTPTSTSSE